VKTAKHFNFNGVIIYADLGAVRSLIERAKNTVFFRERRARNVAPPAPDFSREEFWHVLVGCLLTTQQRSTKGSPVNRFLDAKTFPLTLDACSREASVQQFVQIALKNFGAIRRGVTIASQAADNWKRLEEGFWKEAKEWFERLSQQRSREPQKEHRTLERDAAHWADVTFAGLGPKQSRNLWQWLGLTRYEIPLDGRVTNWVNTNLAHKIDPKRLNQLKYYESVLDYVQSICDKAGVLPCELDAAAFDFEDLGFGNERVRATTEPGFANPHGQITIRNTGKPGTDHNQYVYQIACSSCGLVYGANGSDIFERKCPNCQDGRPGMSL
jgi:hypothetical protein